MEGITRTCWGGLLQTCMWLRRPYIVLPNTTLNEKLGIRETDKPPVGVYPFMGYLAVGNGGHKLSLSADGVLGTDPLQQKATNGSPFKLMPFVLREQSDDLTQAQRARFALRKEEEHGGVRYYAYYLMRLPLENVNPSLESLVIDGGVKTVAPYVPDSSVLNPVPDELSPTGVNTVDGDYISVTAKVPVDLTADDMTELLNVAKILFGDEKYAIVSEFVMCQGLDKMVDSPAPGNATIPFNEAIAVQVASFVPGFVAAKFSKTGFDMMLDAGTTEPLFSAAPG
jgi:hypothetical protein